MDIQQAWQQLLHYTQREFQQCPGTLGPQTSAMLGALANPPLDLPPGSTDVPWQRCVDSIADAELKNSLAVLLPALPWVTSGPFTTDDEINQAYVELIGPEGLIPNTEFRYGIYWQQANISYPSHRHNAQELYYIVAGTALWQRGQQAHVAQPPGRSFEHLDRLDHATKTQTEDLLTLWAWHGDISFDSYSMDH